MFRQLMIAIVGAFLYSVPAMAGSTDLDTKCLTDVMYYEARGESLNGQVAVAYVILNRVNDSKFPKTICEVVYQKDKNICQFSWVCNQKPIPDPKQWEVWLRIWNLAHMVLTSNYQDPTKGSLFFRRKEVRFNSQLESKLQLQAQIGNHIFLGMK